MLNDLSYVVITRYAYMLCVALVHSTQAEAFKLSMVLRDPKGGV
jgi:hypothetical protein